MFYFFLLYLNVSFGMDMDTALNILHFELPDHDDRTSQSTK